MKTIMISIELRLLRFVRSVSVVIAAAGVVVATGVVAVSGVAMPFSDASASESEPAHPSIARMNAAKDHFAGSGYAEGFEAGSNSVGAGSVPTGLALGVAKAMRSGGPAALGASTFAASNSNAMSIASVGFTESLQGGFAQGLPGVGMVGLDYSYTFKAEAAASVSYSVTAGSVPAGLTLDAATGVLSGTPAAAGKSTFTIVASNSEGDTASKSYTVSIQPVWPGLVRGMDISYWQGVAADIPWQQALDRGAQFTYIKAYEGYNYPNNNSAA